MNLLLLFIFFFFLLQFSYFVNINCVIIFFSAYGHEREPPKIEHNLGHDIGLYPEVCVGRRGCQSHMSLMWSAAEFLCVWCLHQLLTRNVLLLGWWSDHLQNRE